MKVETKIINCKEPNKIYYSVLKYYHKYKREFTHNKENYSIDKCDFKGEIKRSFCLDRYKQAKAKNNDKDYLKIDYGSAMKFNYVEIECLKEIGTINLIKI